MRLVTPTNRPYFNDAIAALRCAARSGLSGAALVRQPRQLDDPLRCLPEDLDGHVPAHRECRQGEAIRRCRKRASCHRPHALIERQIRDLRVRDIAERGGVNSISRYDHTPRNGPKRTEDGATRDSSGRDWFTFLQKEARPVSDGILRFRDAHLSVRPAAQS